MQASVEGPRKLVSEMKRGALIVFEGCDRVGKTTQLKKLTEGLNNSSIRNEIVSFPNRKTAIGSVIDQYLTKNENIPDKAIHLLFSANRWEFEPKMCELILNGTTLIVDRYSYSGIAFSLAKKNMEERWCWQPEIGLPKPDLVLFLSIPLQKAAERPGFGEEIYDDKNFQQKVIDNFQKFIDSTWKIVNADRKIEEVHEEILDSVKNIIFKVGTEPLLRFT